MKASDEIANNKIFLEAAKKIDPINYKDLFSECWLKIREKELKDEEWKPDNCYSFFYTILKNNNTDKQRSVTRHRKHNNTWKELQLNISIKDYSFDEFLIEWLDEKTDDEALNFYKQVIFLVLHNETVTGLIEELNMCGKTFYKHYKTAKEILRHDYITSADNNIFFSSPLV